jgi:exopolyphosphatase / guanosine-5'-triphosphate,3'-diphosphate pyrophosphatase
MNNTAIIDLGTNTFDLLIVDGAQKIIHEEKMPVKMGMGGINEGVITGLAIERTIDALQVFAKRCKELNVVTIHAFGTSAFRNAKNAAAIIKRAKAEAGIDIKIISGDQEAQLIYVGVKQAVRLEKEKSLIVDIGGGSVEFIIADETEIFWKQSLEVGGQRLLERFHRHEPILPEELFSLKKYLSESLSPIVAPLRQHSPMTMVGTSGTFETLSDIYCVRKNVPNPQNPESPLTIDMFQKIYSDLVAMNKEARVAMPGMMVWRADMIVVTCCLIQAILELHRFNQIRVSRYSLKEGIMATIFGTELKAELERVVKEKGYTEDDFRKMLNDKS